MIIIDEIRKTVLIVLVKKLGKYFIIAIFSFLSVSDYAGGVEEKPPHGLVRYFELKKIYSCWEAGLFGSRGYYRKRLEIYLNGIIGSEIITGRDYKITISGMLEKKYFSSDLYNEKWLVVHGPVGDATLRRFREKGVDYIKEVERNKSLFVLSGKIKKFRIFESHYERYRDLRKIHLYLESVEINSFMK